MLTPEQRKLVEDNEKLIYEFARKYNLSLDVYYGILAIELCRAAMDYDPSMGFTFCTLAFKYMQNGFYKDYRANNVEKRTCSCEKLFLDARIDDMDFSEVVGSNKDDPYVLIEGSTLLHDLYSICKSDKDFALIDYLIKGYSYEEIAKAFKTSRQNVYQRLGRIRLRYVQKYGNL